MRRLCLVAALASCGAPAAKIALVESFPVETSLDDPAIPEAHRVWVEMIDAARSSLELTEFYASNRPGSRLEPVVQAVERAARRGVAVRFLSSRAFASIYPETLARLRRTAGVEVKLIDDLHAKYFVVDRREAYLGSQNFDWRSLTHIHEMGVRIGERAVVDGLARIFELDWSGAGAASGVSSGAGAASASAELELVASPGDRLPAGVAWNLPRLVAMIDGARQSARVQLLSYRDDEPELSRALVEAGARGVEVQMLVASWNLAPGRVGALKALARRPGVAVKFVTIPAASTGFIPYARVVHAKYLVIDGRRSWVGTSNWGRDYFRTTRNVGVISADRSIAVALDRVFARVWTSAYATAIDPDADYPAPRISATRARHSSSSRLIRTMSW